MLLILVSSGAFGVGLVTDSDSTDSVVSIIVFSWIGVCRLGCG